MSDGQEQDARLDELIDGLASAGYDQGAVEADEVDEDDRRRVARDVAAAKARLRSYITQRAARAAFVEAARWMWNHGWQAVAATDGDDAIEAEAERRYPAQSCAEHVAVSRDRAGRDVRQAEPTKGT